MATSPDSYPVPSPDSRRNWRASLDPVAPDHFSGADPFAVSLGAALDLFLAAKAAEGVSPRTVEWYRYVIGRAVRRFGADRPLDGVGAAELRAWLLELRQTLAPESIAGYTRGLKAFGNWCAAEELGTAAGFRALRRPHVPRRIIAPFTDAELQRLLAIAEPRERALILLLLDTGLRLAEVTGLRVADLRPDGTMRVMGKGSKERIVPLGATARRALLRYDEARVFRVASQIYDRLDFHRSTFAGLAGRSAEAGRPPACAPGVLRRSSLPTARARFAAVPTSPEERPACGLAGPSTTARRRLRAGPRADRVKPRSSSSSHGPQRDSLRSMAVDEVGSAWSAASGSPMRRRITSTRPDGYGSRSLSDSLKARASGSHDVQLPVPCRHFSVNCLHRS